TLTATPSSTVTASAQVSGQSCGQAARTIFLSSGAFFAGASIGIRNSTPSGTHAGERPEARAQHLPYAVVPVARRGDRPAQRKESVDLALEAFVDDGDAGLREPVGIGLALVEQGIEACRENVGVRQARVVRRAQGGCAPVQAVALVAQVL